MQMNNLGMSKFQVLYEILDIFIFVPIRTFCLLFYSFNFNEHGITSQLFWYGCVLQFQQLWMGWNGRDFNSINGDYNICIVYLLGIVCCVVIFIIWQLKKSTRHGYINNSEQFCAIENGIEWECISVILFREWLDEIGAKYKSTSLEIWQMWKFSLLRVFLIMINLL